LDLERDSNKTRIEVERVRKTSEEHDVEPIPKPTSQDPHDALLPFIDVDRSAVCLHWHYNTTTMPASSFLHSHVTGFILSLSSPPCA